VLPQLHEGGVDLLVAVSAVIDNDVKVSSA
jgi:hypothetical protein